MPATDNGVVEGGTVVRGSAIPLRVKVLFGPVALRVNTQMPLGTPAASNRSTAMPDCWVPLASQEVVSPERLSVIEYSGESAARGVAVPVTRQPPMRPESWPCGVTVSTHPPPNRPVPRYVPSTRLARAG